MTPTEQQMNIENGDEQALDENMVYHTSLFMSVGCCDVHFMYTYLFVGTDL